MKRFPIMIGYDKKDYIPYDVIKPHERAVGEKVARLNIDIRNKEASLHG